MVRQKKHDDILELLREEGAEAARKAQRGLIIQPGAIGDCVLTLPLAGFMKEALGLGGVDMLGHSEYIEFLPGRSCIDGISSIDSVDMHRLFADRKQFDLADRDPLISAFCGYAWIATFLGEPNSDFEHNLIYTANCSGSAEVMTLALKPPKSFAGHVTEFYIQQCIAQAGLSAAPEQARHPDSLITATGADTAKGRELLVEAGFDPDQRPIVIHPGSGGAKKCWHLDNFLAAAQRLKSDGLQVLLLLGPAESDRYNKAELQKMGSAAPCFSGLSLTEVLGLLISADAFVGNDSGITHLAAGLGIRTFALFGPTDPCLYGPIGRQVTILANSPKTFARKPSVRSQSRLVDAVLSG
ncbi:MAG: glycosyltransferase family 9 protein [Sedimentisphaerales bacterium]|nr:glycosyltransferase family 9 protein [Sedimentisphaerales bacterium]